MELSIIKKQLDDLFKERDEASHKLIEIEGAIKALNNLLESQGSSISIEQNGSGERSSKLYYKNPASLAASLIGEEDSQKKKYVFDDGYHVNLSNRNKVKLVIKSFNKFVHNRQISEELHAREPEISEDDWAKKVSGALSSLRQKNQLVNYAVNGYNRNTFWGSPKWLDDNGEIISDYMYDEEYLQGDSETITI
ncbi:MAG: hypothetical protein RLN90_01075 [Balneolaceae bacterium]